MLLGVHFNPRPPARGATALPGYILCSNVISIHAPRKGGDSGSIAADGHSGISIHAPRKGGDSIL